VYHIDVESYGRDINQSADVALVGGQEAYVRVESFWASGYGPRGMAGRDTFYARQILPETARVEVCGQLIGTGDASRCHPSHTTEHTGHVPGG
jgi:hypothetical protein